MLLLTEQHRLAFAEQHDAHAREMALLQEHLQARDCRIRRFLAACHVMAFFLMLLLLVDILNPDIDWVRRMSDLMSNRTV